MIFKAEAAEEIVEAVHWYEEQRVGLGAKFQAVLDRVFVRIQQEPESHRLVYRGVRRALTPGFPFAIYYRIDQDELVVLAVVHSSRDPNRWKSRL